MTPAPPVSRMPPPPVPFTVRVAPLLMVSVSEPSIFKLKIVPPLVAKLPVISLFEFKAVKFSAVEAAAKPVSMP